MFHLTFLGWLIIRADSLGQFATLASSLVTGFDPSLTALAEYGVPLAWTIVPLLVIHGIEFANDDLSIEMRWPFAVKSTVCVALTYLIVLFGNFEGAQFIYFQF